MRKAGYHFFKTREVGRGVGGGGVNMSEWVKIYIRSKYQYCTNLGGFKTGGAILRNHRQFYLEQDNMN